MALATHAQGTAVPTDKRTKATVAEAPQPVTQPAFRDRLTELLVEHRWATVVPVVLPLSKLYDAYWTARHVIARNLLSSAHLHDQRVRDVQKQIASWHERGRPGLLHTSRKAFLSVTVRAIDYKKQTESGIDVDMHDVLELDVSRGVVRVEPRVNMAQLTRWLVSKGYTIPVVPELDDLTVGGLILGYGIESSSHKYGLFADTVRAVELVLADGRALRASPQENADLFHALPWSYGALGIVTAVELPILPCSSHVRVTYTPVEGLDEICRAFAEAATAEHPPEFLDALLFDREHAVLVTAEFADLPADTEENCIGRFYKPWFYKHIESFLGHESEPEVHEYIPLRDYYHRYTRSLYWHGELLVPFGNSPWFRYLLGWLMPPKVSLLRLVQSERMRKFRDEHNVVQDGLVPLQHLREGIELFDREFECYPLWLCGHRMFRTQPQGMLSPSSPSLAEEMFVDIGAWQVPGFVKRNEPWSGTQAVKNLEAWLRAHHGYQCLYAVTEQTREQFWQMFDDTLYTKVRKKYGAHGAFMDVFDKVKRPGQT